jgi:hypothetical protein
LRVRPIIIARRYTYVLMAPSLIRYVLFFSLRFRLKTSLILTGLSLAGLAGVAIWLVP